MTPYQEWKKSLGETRPWDAINPNAVKASDEEADRRMDLCKECPSFLKITSQCKECGCFMKIKTKLNLATCPLGKW
jgi:hypothetical protein